MQLTSGIIAVMFPGLQPRAEEVPMVKASWASSRCCCLLPGTSFVTLVPTSTVCHPPLVHRTRSRRQSIGRCTQRARRSARPLAGSCSVVWVCDVGFCNFCCFRISALRNFDAHLSLVGAFGGPPPSCTQTLSSASSVLEEPVAKLRCRTSKKPKPSARGR